MVSAITALPNPKNKSEASETTKELIAIDKNFIPPLLVASNFILPILLAGATFAKVSQQYTNQSQNFQQEEYFSWKTILQYQIEVYYLVGRSRSCKRSETLFKSLLFWLAGEVNWPAVEVLSPCQK